MKIEMKFILTLLILATNSALAYDGPIVRRGGGSSGGRGNVAKGCLIDKIAEEIEYNRTDNDPNTPVILPYWSVQRIAFECCVSRPVVQCLADLNANGNLVSENLIAYCESLAGN